MADNYMKAKSAISGIEGEVTMTYEGKVISVLECKNISAKIDKDKAEFKALGQRGTQYKATGWKGSGTMTVYYASSRWAAIMLDYVNNGLDHYFELIITNDDPTSDIGVQSIVLKDVNIDSIDIAKLDTDSQFLDQEVAFTFSGVDFNPIAGNGEGKFGGLKDDMSDNLSEGTLAGLANAVSTSNASTAASA